MLEEMVQIALRVWSGEKGNEHPFEGKHYKLAQCSGPGHSPQGNLLSRKRRRRRQTMAKDDGEPTTRETAEHNRSVGGRCEQARR